MSVIKSRRSLGQAKNRNKRGPPPVIRVIRTSFMVMRKQKSAPSFTSMASGVVTAASVLHFAPSDETASEHLDHFSLDSAIRVRGKKEGRRGTQLFGGKIRGPLRT